MVTIEPTWRERLDDARRAAQAGEAFTKEEAPCCNAARDRDGRLPIGFCGPDCVRREWRRQEFARRRGTDWRRR